MARAARPNDSCPCGSGLKFKKCCDRPAGTAKPPPAGYTSGDRATALEKLAILSDDERWVDDYDDALDELWGAFGDEQDQLPDHLFDMSNAVLDGWFFFDYPLTDGRRLVDHLLDDRRLTIGERAYLRAMRETTMRLYEVTDTVPGASITLKDLVEGTTTTVNERSASHQVLRHDCLAARIVPRGHSGRPELDQGLLSIVSALRDGMIAAVEGFKAENPSLSVDEVYKQMPPIFHEAWLSSIFDPAIPELRTTDGELIMFTRVSFDTTNSAAVSRALGKQGARDGLQRVAEGAWTWTAPGSGGSLTSLGAIELSESTLTLETHSLERAARGRALIEKLAGAHVRHRETTHEDVREQVKAQLKARALGQSPPEPENDQAVVDPRMAQAMIDDHYEKHYRAWVDEPVPALDGKTPRQASTDPLLRPRLVRLIEELETMGERERRAGKPGYDPAWMWSELRLR